MKRILTVIFFLIIAIDGKSAPFAVFNYKIFHLPGEGPIVEIYLDFNGRSIAMVPTEEGTVQGLVELTAVFRKGEKIETYDKKVISTPSMTPGNIVDFLDIQRFRVAPGSYVLELQINDLNDVEGTAVKQEVEVFVPQVTSQPFMSDVLMVMAYKKAENQGPFTRSGFDLLPMVSDDYVGANVNELMYYTELYNTDKLGDELFLLTTYIVETTTGEPLPDSRRYERKSTAKVVPLLYKTDISTIETGDYQLIVEARDRANNLLAKQEHAFARNFAGVAIDLTKTSDEELMRAWVKLYDQKNELYEFIQSIRPIADESERYTLETSLNNPHTVGLEQLQAFFYQFWEKRQKGDGETAWLAYKEKVDFVEQTYATRNKRGYETDRGRVYLQYGAPEDVMERANEPSSYPYEIWRYYKADRWNNVRFVFFDPNLAGDDYVLLHCERIPGEIMNPQWRLLLEQRNTPMNDVDRQRGNEYWGGRVDEFFDNPR